MCLSSRLDPQELQRRLPEGEEFYAYKMVNRSGGELVSPVYSYVWKPGELEAELRSRGNGDAGFYVTLFNPGEVLSAYSGKALLKLRVKKQDIVAGGPDSIGGVTGTCLVVKKVVLLEEDHKNALDVEKQQITVEKFEMEMAPKVAEAVEKGEEKVEQATQVAQKVARGTRKTKAQFKKEQEEADKPAEETPVEKAAKKTAKKITKATKKKEEKGLMAETVSALKATAKALKITGFGKMTKDALVKAIKKAQRVTKKKND